MLESGFAVATDEPFWYYLKRGEDRDGIWVKHPSASSAEIAPGDIQVECIALYRHLALYERSQLTDKADKVPRSMTAFDAFYQGRAYEPLPTPGRTGSLTRIGLMGDQAFHDFFLRAAIVEAQAILNKFRVDAVSMEARYSILLYRSSPRHFRAVLTRANTHHSESELILNSIELDHPKVVAESKWPSRRDLPELRYGLVLAPEWRAGTLLRGGLRCANAGSSENKQKRS